MSSVYGTRMWPFGIFISCLIIHVEKKTNNLPEALHEMEEKSIYSTNVKQCKAAQSHQFDFCLENVCRGYEARGIEKKAFLWAIGSFYEISDRYVAKCMDLRFEEWFEYLNKSMKKSNTQRQFLLGSSWQCWSHCAKKWAKLVWKMLTLRVQPQIFLSLWQAWPLRFTSLLSKFRLLLH